MVIISPSIDDEKLLPLIFNSYKVSPLNVLKLVSAIGLTAIPSTLPLIVTLFTVLL